MTAYHVLLLFLTALCTFTFGRQPNQNANVMISQAELEAKNRNALSASTNSIEALLDQAIIHAQQGDHATAFHFYDNIVRFVPDNAFAWNGRGLAAFNMKDFEEALKSFQQAITEKPTDCFFEALAWTLICRSEYDQAAEVAKKASLMYSQSGEKTVYPLLVAYFSYLEINDIKNASRTLDYMLSNTSNHEWPRPIIEYLSERIDATEMISFVKNPSQETEAHTYIGMKLRNEGKLDDSKRHLEWVSRKGDSRLFEYTLACTLHLQSNLAILDRKP